MGRPQKQREDEDLLEDQDPKIPLLIHTDNISHNIYICRFVRNKFPRFIFFCEIIHEELNGLDPGIYC